jgi:hypothetical protein
MVPYIDRQNPFYSGAGPVPLRTALVSIWICVLCALVATPADAQDDGPTRLELGQPYLLGDVVWLDLSMTALIRGQALDALRSGLPATVVFEWRIWQRRDGWWDQEVETGAVYYRVFYDVLQERYDVFDHRGRSLASSEDPEEIERVISGGPGLKLVPAERLHINLMYYVEVLARIELLSDEEVRNLEEWLAGSGKSAGGRDPVRKISNRLSRALGGIVGPDDKTVVSKTDDFSGF